MKVSSVKKVNHDLSQEINQALKEVEINGWGSVEIYIQNHKVVQITSRNIKKTNHTLIS